MTKPLVALCALLVVACTPPPAPAPAPVPLATASAPRAPNVPATPRPDPPLPPTAPADIAGTIDGAGLGGGFTLNSPGHRLDDISLSVIEQTVIWVPDGDAGYRRGSVGDLADGREVQVWLSPIVNDSAPPQGTAFEILVLRQDPPAASPTPSASP